MADGDTIAAIAKFNREMGRLEEGVENLRRQQTDAVSRFVALEKDVKAGFAAQEASLSELKTQLAEGRGGIKAGYLVVTMVISMVTMIISLAAILGGGHLSH